MNQMQYPELDAQSAFYIESMKKHAPKAAAQNLSESEKVQQQRQGFKKAIPAAGPPEAVFKIEEKSIALPGREISVRLYYPNDQPELPALVYYHGGGFIAGGFDTHEQMLCYLANHAQVLVVAVAYRLAPEHPYPAALEDANATLEWVRTQASEIGADPDRVATGGDSSGGALVVATAIYERDHGKAIPLFQLLFCPTLDLTMSSESWNTLGNKGYILSAAQVKQYYNWYAQNADKKDPGVSPLFNADFSHLPQALVITASADPQKDEGRQYAENLKAAGVTVTHHEYQGVMHGFYQMSAAFDKGKSALQQAAQALREAMNSI